MTTVRLPEAMEQRLCAVSAATQKTKSELVKTALEDFFYREEHEKDAYEIGEPYFGRYGSGDGELSTEYKTRLKEKIHAKFRSH